MFPGPLPTQYAVVPASQQSSQPTPVPAYPADVPTPVIVRVSAPAEVARSGSAARSGSPAATGELLSSANDARTINSEQLAEAKGRATLSVWRNTSENAPLARQPGQRVVVYSANHTVEAPAPDEEDRSPPPSSPCTGGDDVEYSRRDSSPMFINAKTAAQSRRVNITQVAVRGYDPIDMPPPGDSLTWHAQHAGGASSSKEEPLMSGRAQSERGESETPAFAVFAQNDIARRRSTSAERATSPFAFLESRSATAESRHADPQRGPFSPGGGSARSLFFKYVIAALLRGSAEPVPLKCTSREEGLCQNCKAMFQQVAIGFHSELAENIAIRVSTGEKRSGPIYARPIVRPLPAFNPSPCVVWINPSAACERAKELNCVSSARTSSTLRTCWWKFPSGSQTRTLLRRILHEVLSDHLRNHCP